MSVPSTYEHATKLGADGRAALACARLLWDALPKESQRVLAQARKCPSRGTRVLRDGRARARGRLVVEGLASSGTFVVTPLGLLVREAGIIVQAVKT